MIRGTLVKRGDRAVVLAVAMQDERSFEHMDLERPMNPDEVVAGTAVKEWEDGVHELSEDDVLDLFPGLAAESDEEEQPRLPGKL